MHQPVLPSLRPGLPGQPRLQGVQLQGRGSAVHLRRTRHACPQAGAVLRKKRKFKENFMKKFAIAAMAAALSLPLLCQDCSAAGGEPSWEACDDLGGNANVRMCQDKVVAYWDKRLNAAYQKVKKNCGTAQCPKKLQNAEREWIKYRDLMVEAAGEAAGGYEAKGSMIYAMEQTRYLATKHQALVLEHLLDD